MISQLEVSLPSAHAAHPAVQGVLHLFVNPHRGFFTTVIAQAMRLAGQGTPVLVVQLLKGGIHQGPANPMNLGSHLQWVRCAVERCIDSPHLEPEEAVAFGEIWQFTQEAIQSGRYGLVILDELSLAIQLGLVDEAAVVDLLDNRPTALDVVITGPEMPEALLERAEQITQLRHGGW